MYKGNEKQSPGRLWHLTLHWHLLGGQKYKSGEPCCLMRQVNDLLLRLHLSAGTRLRLSMAVFDWPKEPQELQWSVWVAQTNWFCFLVLPNVYVWACICAQTACSAHIHMQKGCICGEEHYQNCTNACTRTHSQTTNTELWHTSRIFQTGRDIEAVISLFISIWEQFSWHMFKVV